MANYDCQCLKSEDNALHNWSLFPSDNGDLSIPLPQEAESEICDWLKKIAFSTGMISNPNRLYGKILFNDKGDIADFEIGTLNYTMLQPGFKNWMNTLASGEILLDIVNSMLAVMPAAVRDSYFSFVPSNGLPVNRMVDNSPNLHGKCNFLRNHNTLVEDFLIPTLDSQANIRTEAQNREMPTRGRYDIRRILDATKQHQYALLRCRYTTDVQDTWKALMMVVLTLMVICDCLDERMARLVCFLTQGDMPQIFVSRPLAEAFQIIRSRAEPPNSELRKMELRQCRFPFTRVLKQGVIPCPRSLLSNCGDNEPDTRFYPL